eukprot:3182331-Prymnesium_polylepis.1
MLNVLEKSMPDAQALPEAKLQLAQAATLVAQSLSLDTGTATTATTASSSSSSQDNSATAAGNEANSVDATTTAQPITLPPAPPVAQLTKAATILDTVANVLRPGDGGEIENTLVSACSNLLSGIEGALAENSQASASQ